MSENLKDLELPTKNHNSVEAVQTKLRKQNSKKQPIQEKGQRNRKHVSLSTSILISLLALLISAGHFFCDHLHKINQLSLMVSGFNLVTVIDSSGLVTDRTMSIDLAFTNNGNQHQSILGAKFILPQRADLTGDYWNMRYQRVTIDPIMIAPGEIIVRRIVQPTDEDALIGHKQSNPDSSWFNDDPEHQVIAVEITAITPSGLPGQCIVPIVSITTNSLVTSNRQFYCNVDIENPLGGVIYLENIFKHTTTGRSCFIDSYVLEGDSGTQ